MIKVLFENLSIKAFKQTSEEYTAGQITTVTADFRKYGCIEDSVADHSAYLNGAKNGSKLRYEGLKGCTDYKKAIQIIKDSISQAITWANEQRNQAGDPVRGARYGYRKDKKPVEGIHHWHINEEEAVRVRMAYKLCEEGKAFAAIARELNAFEAEHGATRKWSPQSVKSLLWSEVYVGDILTAQSFTVDYLTKKRKANEGEREQQYLKDHHPGIISREQDARVKAVLERRRENGKTKLNC